MRLAVLIISILATCAVSCSEDDPTVAPSNANVSGTVVVFIHWDGQGLEDRRVELVELGIELTTNREGLAEFVAPAGRYTLRAYEINEGGPMLQYVDTDIVVEPNKTIRVEIVNCLPCV